VNALRALLFDKDGTLVDFDRTWGPAAGEVIRRIAHGNADHIARLQDVSHFLPDEDRFLPTSPLLAGSSAEYGPLWAEILGRTPDRAFLTEIDVLFREEGRRFITPIGTPKQAFTRLKAAGFELGIASNDAEANTRLQADLLGLTGLLAGVYGYDSGHGAKPGPGMIEAFCRDSGFAPHEVALIGDTHHDLVAAKAAGANAILVRSGPAAVDPFANEADLIIDDVDALADLLTQTREAVAS
jgi:phosphoglycolate phosphatase